MGFLDDLKRTGGAVLEGVFSPEFTPVVAEIGNIVMGRNQSLPPINWYNYPTVPIYQRPEINPDYGASGAMQGPALPPSSVSTGNQIIDLLQDYVGLGSGSLMGKGIDWLQRQASGQEPRQPSLPWWFTPTNGGNMPNGSSLVPHAQHTPLAYPMAAGVRMASEVHVLNPANGRMVTYKNMGRPVLYSGDISAAKRVKKVAARARRAAGKR